MDADFISTFGKVASRRRRMVEKTALIRYGVNGFKPSTAHIFGSRRAVYLRRQTDLGDIELPEHVEHGDHVLVIHIVGTFNDDA
jgi:hypothetical protein